MAGMSITHQSQRVSCESNTRNIKSEIIVANTDILFGYRNTIWTTCSCCWFLQPVILQTDTQRPYDYWKMHGRDERKSAPRTRVLPHCCSLAYMKLSLLKIIPRGIYFPGVWGRELFLRKRNSTHLSSNGESSLGKCFISLLQCYSVHIHLRKCMHTSSVSVGGCTSTSLK